MGLMGHSSIFEQSIYLRQRMGRKRSATLKIHQCEPAWSPDLSSLGGSLLELKAASQLDEAKPIFLEHPQGQGDLF